MRTIIAGSRTIKQYSIVEYAVNQSGFNITTLISGTAGGIDQLGEKWAREHGVYIRLFPASWNLYGKSAGYKRNEEMSNNADALIAIWDGESKGTKHMIDIAKRKGLKIFILDLSLCKHGYKDWSNCPDCGH